MYYAILAAWLAASVLLWANYATSLRALDSATGKVLAGLITFLVDLSWMYGFYHIGFVSFARLYPDSLSSRDSAREEPLCEQPVAVLLTVCDDFQPPAAHSCVTQDYPDFHVYVLDDSSGEQMKEKVDTFQKNFPKKVTVMRREDRKGFKAGNLNNCLSLLPEKYAYIALADSDTHLPAAFLRIATGLLEVNSSKGFVQALHIANAHHRQSLARDLGEIVRVGWCYYQPLRNKYGFPMCYGHGALIRRSALKVADGFPEIVSEDIALTLRLRRQGIRGLITSGSICGEDFPDDYYTFRKRLSRWVAADLECFREELVPFLSSKNILIIEKLDALFRGLKVPLSLLFLPVAVLVNVMAVLFPAWESSVAWPTLAITMLSIFAPYYCFTVDLTGQPKRLVLLLSQLTAVYCSGMLLIIVNALQAIYSRRAQFYVSGVKEDRKLDGSLLRRYLSMDKAGYPLLGFFEVSAALLLILFALQTENLTLIGVAAAMALAPAIDTLGWENRLVTWFVHLPFSLIVTGIVSPWLFGHGSTVQILTLAGLSILLF